ncbi:MAG: hypothetical protein SFT68_03945 [Rickettsiaceae bacterium]|nr:hypothetical protein [Rickettsiaceae bacterium]
MSKDRSDLQPQQQKEILYDTYKQLKTKTVAITDELFDELSKTEGRNAHQEKQAFVAEAIVRINSLKPESIARNQITDYAKALSSYLHQIRSVAFMANGLENNAEYLTKQKQALRLELESIKESEATIDKKAATQRKAKAPSSPSRRGLQILTLNKDAKTVAELFIDKSSSEGATSDESSDKTPPKKKIAQSKKPVLQRKKKIVTSGNVGSPGTSPTNKDQPYHQKLNEAFKNKFNLAIERLSQNTILSESRRAAYAKLKIEPSESLNLEKISEKVYSLQLELDKDIKNEDDKNKRGFRGYLKDVLAWTKASILYYGAVGLNMQPQKIDEYKKRMDEAYNKSMSYNELRLQIHNNQKNWANRLITGTPDYVQRS